MFLQILFVHTTGGRDMVLISDPNSLEAILRAEGKYPMRDTSVTPRMTWLLKKLNYPIFLANK